MNRPYIICHMMTSIDGKVTGDFLNRPECEEAVNAYYEVNRQLSADAFACGRVTMEESFTKGEYPDLYDYATDRIPRQDYIANPKAGFYAVAFDRFGRLGWTSSKIKDDDPGYSNAHIIQVMCEVVSDEYLNYLRKTGVSYIFAGEIELDLSVALEKLKKLFGIETMLLEGGSLLNGSFAREGFVDEISLVVAPVTAEADDKPLFDEGIMSSFGLSEVEKMNNSSVWLRYKK